MKLTAVLLLGACLQLAARTSGQTVTLNVKNAPLKEVFREIQKQTGLNVIVKEMALEKSNRVTLDVKNMPLEQVLNLCFKNEQLSYSIIDGTIVVKPLQIIAPPSGGPSPINYSPPPINIWGKVVNAEGKPVAGASVMLRPSNIGGTTGDNGEFTLSNVNPGNYTLEISSVGYAKISRRITAGNDDIRLNFSMELALQRQEEVIVSTGYSSRKTGEITGSVQRISGDELRRGITTADPASLLKGRTTGLYISEQGAGDPTSVSQIFVRGQSNIAGVGVDQVNEFVMPKLNYGPLLVLDGVIMPNQNLKELVTPQEIQEIVILKDASATAIYGSRAAAGVLVVTTIRGRADKARIYADLKYGINVPNRGTMRWLTGPELYEVQKGFFIENYKQNPGLANTYPTQQAYLDNRLPTLAEVANSYDWTKFIYSTSNTKEANISASGGNDKTRYYVGAGYYKEQSTGVQNELTRKSVRINMDSRLSDRLKVNLSVNGIINNGKRDPDGNATFEYNRIPWANPINADGSISPSYRYKLNGSIRTADNPLFSTQYNFMNVTSQLFFGSARLEYKITNWLNFSSTNSGNLNYNKTERYQDVRTYSGSALSTSPKGFLGTFTSYLNNFLTSNQLNFGKTYGKHSLRALAAMEYGQTKIEDITVNVNNVRAGYPIISLAGQIGGRNDLSAFGIPTTKAGNIEGGKDVSAVYSAFAEAGYTYNEKYTFNGSIRSDASSSFGPDNRYGTFYSGGAAWIVSKESFMQNTKWVNNLKLRASYGTSGSQLGDNFLTTTLYDPRFNYSGAPAATLATLGNPDLQWEVTKTLSGGIEVGLFKAIDLTIDLYDRRSEGLLQKVTLSPLAGFPVQWRNVASVQNRGIELMINTRNITGKDFQWTTSFNFTHNKNKILSVANDSLKQGFYTANSYYMFPGEDINTLKAIKYAGVDPATGRPLFEKLIFDNSGKRVGVEYVNTLAAVNGAIDKRQFQPVGSFQPKFFGGLINNFNYKSISLSVMITYALDYVMRDALAEQNQGANITSFNQLAYRPDQVQWTTPGQTNATEPWFYYQVTTNYFGSSKYIHDASHAALRNVRLSYDLPTSLMHKIKMSNCSVYVSGDNLLWLYSKEIVASNPEGPSVGQAQDFGGSSFGIGIPRRYNIGLQLTF